MLIVARALKYTKEDFLMFLNKLDIRLRDNIFIIALGGTALSLMGLKEKTKDMDFFMEGLDFDSFDSIIERLSEEEKIPRKDIDYWIGGEILFVKGQWLESRLPPDYITIASDYKDIKLEHIILKVLNPVDLVITKVGRFNDQDRIDITNLIKIYNINKKLLEDRFNYFVNSYTGNKEPLINNFNFVLKEYYSD